ncbi:MAG: PQQ-binding-like beta-propeller repeat protein [Bacterioplanes sp.]|nr:PQQ-binding-like beta-propeller repeat protein [Bacterioplanes sp.]
MTQALSLYMTPRRISTLLLSVVLLSGCDNAKAPSHIDVVADSGVYSMRFSDRGQDVMVGSVHHGGSLWTLDPPERRFDWNHSPSGYSNILNSAFSGDGQFVATTDNRTIVLWHRSTGEAEWFWHAPGDIQDIALSNDGGLALLALRDYTATLFDIKNGGIVRRLSHDGSVYSVSLSANGRIAASGSDDLSARVWDVITGQELLRLDHSNQVRTVQLSPDGSLLFTSAMGNRGKIWRVSDGTLLQEIDYTRGHYSAARFSPNSQQLLTGNSSGQISLWNVADGQRVQQWRAKSRNRLGSHNVLVEDVRFQGNYWQAAGANGLVYRLD